MNPSLSVRVEIEDPLFPSAILVIPDSNPMVLAARLEKLFAESRRWCGNQTDVMGRQEPSNQIGACKWFPMASSFPFAEPKGEKLRLRKTDRISVIRLSKRYGSDRLFLVQLNGARFRQAQMQPPSASASNSSRHSEFDPRY
jgi:hypothetical protein